jgi:ABC-type branched-subunit amino acid transport system ATPase component
MPVPRPVASAEPLLAVRHLSVRYGSVTALDRISLEVPGGSITGVIGPNGAGKTSLVDAIGGFVAADGTVTVAGRDVSDLAPHHRARAGLGRTHQGPDLYADLTVRENVVAGGLVGRGPHGSAADDAQQLLGRFGLESAADRLVGELPMGQRRLVSVARALAGRPMVALLDEPAAGLDTIESRALAERLGAVRDDGTSILLVDHDMNLVFDVCDRVIVIDLGRVIAAGTPTEIRADSGVIAAYLGSNVGATA